MTFKISSNKKNIKSWKIIIPANLLKNILEKLLKLISYRWRENSSLFPYLINKLSKNWA